MRIGILGSGLMGGKLGTIFARAGHDVVFSYSHSERKLRRLAREAGECASAGTPREAAADADALLLAVQVVRNAAVDALAPLHPESAAKVWAGHPSVEISRGLAEIARASAGRKPIPKAAFTMIDDGALKAPLSPQPFLVRGVQAQLAGDLESARRAFLAAQWRDPRSMPAAYFLATYYFEAGKTLDGLQ